MDVSNRLAWFDCSLILIEKLFGFPEGYEIDSIEMDFVKRTAKIRVRGECFEIVNRGDIIPQIVPICRYDGETDKTTIDFEATVVLG